MDSSIHTGNEFEFVAGPDRGGLGVGVGGGESGGVPSLPSMIQNDNSAVGGTIWSASLSSAAVLAGVTWFSSMVANVFFLFGPVLMFVPQYRTICETGSAKSFSTTVCFVLLTAHLMRCFFWIGKQFETVQLFQSIFVVASQLVLLRVCVRCNYNERQLKSPSSSLRATRGISTGGAVEMTAVDVSSPATPRSPASSTQTTTIFDDLAAQKFWRWNFFSSYLLFLSSYVLVLLGKFAIYFFFFCGDPARLTHVSRCCSHSPTGRIIRIFNIHTSASLLRLFLFCLFVLCRIDSDVSGQQFVL